MIIVVLLIKNGEDSADISADRLNSDLIGLFKEALRDADVVVLLVDHMQFMSVDRSSLANKVLIDTRGSWR